LPNEPSKLLKTKQWGTGVNPGNGRRKKNEPATNRISCITGDGNMTAKELDANKKTTSKATAGGIALHEWGHFTLGKSFALCTLSNL
jgi:hypothetical protein